jgi:HSP20 family protein
MNMMDELMGFFDSPLAPYVGNRMKLPVDVQETDNAYLVEAELPGFDEKQIKVHVEGGKLTIETAAESEEKKDEQKDRGYLIRERRNLSLSRSFTLPENADTESVSAVFKNGVLSLQIKKRAETAKRLIEITAQ